MSPKRAPLSRRQFLLMGGGTALSALLGGAYLTSACPLSDSGICVGPCTAYIDLDNDGICDHIQDRLSNGLEPAVAGRDGDTKGANAPCLACPFGIANDPYPGKCRHYVDTNNNGICDLSEANSCTDETLERPVQPLVPQENGGTLPHENDGSTPCTACPLGLVNDPFPGECRHYIDKDGNGICDLSEPGSCTDETLEPPSQGRGEGKEGGGQKRRGQRKDGQ